MSEQLNRRRFIGVATLLAGGAAIESALPKGAFAQAAAQTASPQPAAAPADPIGVSIGTLLIGFPGAPVRNAPAAGQAGGATPAPQQQQKKKGPSILGPFGGRSKKDTSGGATPAAPVTGGPAPTYTTGPSSGPKIEYQFFIVNDGDSKYYIMPMSADMNKPAGNMEDPTTDFTAGIGATLRVVVADANGYAKVKSMLNATEMDVITPTDSSGRSLALTTAMILDVAAAVNDKHAPVDMQSHFTNAATGAMGVPIGLCSPTDCSNLANLHAGKGTTVLGFDSNLYQQLNIQPYFVPTVLANQQEIQTAKDAAAAAAAVAATAAAAAAAKAKAPAPKIVAPARKGTTATKTPAVPPAPAATPPAPAAAPVEIPAALTAGDLIAGFSALPKGAPLPKAGTKPPGLVIK